MGLTGRQATARFEQRAESQCPIVYSRDSAQYLSIKRTKHIFITFMLKINDLQLAGQLLIVGVSYCLEYMDGVFEGCMGLLALSIDNRKVVPQWAMIGAGRRK